MTLQTADARASLSGVCAIEEAEALLEWLVNTPSPSVDLSGCTHLHAALLQTLLALRPAIAALPDDPLLVQFLEMLG